MQCRMDRPMWHTYTGAVWYILAPAQLYFAPTLLTAREFIHVSRLYLDQGALSGLTL